MELHMITSFSTYMCELGSLEAMIITHYKDFHFGDQRGQEVFHILNIDGAEEIFIKQCQILNKSYHFTF